MYVGGIPLTAKNTYIYSSSNYKRFARQLWMQVHYFNEDSLEKRYDRIISATDTSCQKTDTNHLLQGTEHSSSSLSMQFSKLYHGMNVQSIH